MVADPALAWSPAIVVHYPEAGEDSHFAIIHLYREMDRQLPLAFHQSYAAHFSDVHLLTDITDESPNILERLLVGTCTHEFTSLFL